MTMSRKVLASIENDDRSHCVDVFMRDDGSYGYEEFRAEADGAARWQPLGRHPGRVFDSGAAALEEAKRRIAWLPASERWRW